ncbi:MAG TPA: TIR domain-containing protein [Sphingobium sp.]
MDENNLNAQAIIAPRSPLIFISHDTRDAELAEAFSRLLGSVSAGVLKTFRSSDKKGNQGIEYGVEWYPEIMKKLDAASDVVCLLTPNSVNRPWILYEAGVARGKLETPVHGVALGIPLQNASTGPFAQFQNSDDSEDALTQLVMQLVRRIPGAEPDRDVVKTQVATFREKALAIAAAPNDAEIVPESDTASVAKLFEEVKVMFQDLPRHIERRVDPDFMASTSRRKRHPARLIREMTREMGRDLPDGVGLLMSASQFRDDFPWIYDMAVDAFMKIGGRDEGAVEALEKLDHVLHVTLDHPIFRETIYRKDRYFDADEMMSLLHESISRSRDRLHSSAKISDSRSQKLEGVRP